MADEHVSIAEAKARFSALVSSVLHRRQRIVIERHGKPVAALVSLEDSDDDGVEGATDPNPRGALAAVGGWRDVPDEEIDAFLEDVYRERARDLGRPVDLD